MKLYVYKKDGNLYKLYFNNLGVMGCWWSAKPHIKGLGEYIHYASIRDFEMIEE